MVRAGTVAACRNKRRWIMRRVILIAGASLGLAGCGSSMPSMDFLKSTPPTATVRLESVPPGADARTSVGPGCKTPCTVSVQTTDTNNFTVTYSLDKYEPQTVSVQTLRQSGDFGSGATVTTDPNPVFAELQPAAPPKRPVRRPAKKKRAPKAAAAPADAAPAGAPAPADNAFPPPAAR